MHESIFTQRSFVVIEFACLFVALPFVFYTLGTNATVFIIPALIVGVLYFYSLSKKVAYQFDPVTNVKKQLIASITVFGIGGSLLTMLTYFFLREQFFRLPFEHTGLWLTIIVLYPLLSVVPQELIYRKYFFKRYERFTGSSELGMLILSSAAFSLAHLIFANWQALALTALGGLLFGFTYLRSRSILCASIEHALWGNLIFTIGLGEYFVGGTVKHLLDTL